MATSGFLDDTWHDRMYWIYSRLVARAALYGTKIPKAGQILVFDDTTTYALKAFAEPGGMSPKFVPGTGGYRLTADANDCEPTRTSAGRRRRSGRCKCRSAPGRWCWPAGRCSWPARPTWFPRTIPTPRWKAARARRSGPSPPPTDTSWPSIRLPSPPVFDGMAAAGGRLYLSAIDGTVVSLGGRQRSPGHSVTRDSGHGVARLLWSPKRRPNSGG